MYRIDLHSHSINSTDGSITIEDYDKIIKSGRLNYIAITDHNSIDYAKKANAKLGENIIIGEEIMTLSGEIIGLYLSEKIPPKLSLEETINQIKRQNGLVYLPHPLENIRKGIGLDNLKKIIDKVDIVECYNGRSFTTSIKDQLLKELKLKNIVCASGSDSHGKIGFGRTMTIINDKPNKENLVQLLKNAKFINRTAGPISRFYPTLNRLRAKYDK